MINQNSKNSSAIATDKISNNGANSLLSGHCSTSDAKKQVVISELSSDFLKPKPCTIDEMVDFLVELGLPPLPVAPKQDAKEFPLWVKDKETGGYKVIEKDGLALPKFTGKNPSYLDADGKPTTIKHKEYQKRQPKPHEVIEWFHNPLNGVGTLGGWLGFNFIDFDVKNFDSQEDLDSRLSAFLDATPILKQTWIFRSQSGGYRVVVKPKIIPNFTNFSLDGKGGRHHGEALGECRFTVLPPTIGINGAYVNLNLARPVEVESLEDIGIFPVSAKPERKTGFRKANQKPDTDSVAIDSKFTQNQAEYPYKIDILDFMSASAKLVYEGQDIKNDESASLAFFIQELAGDENWLNDKGIGIINNLNEMVQIAGTKLGYTSRRINSIFNSVNTLDAKPSYWFKNGDIGLWLKIKYQNKEIFEKACKIQDEVGDYLFDRDLAEFKKFRKIENSEKQNNQLKPKDPTKKWADELLSDPDDFIATYNNLQYLGISPTGESGLSFDKRGFFTEKFLVSRGVLSLNNLSQMLFRLRDNTIPCYVSMPKVGNYKHDRDYFVGATEIYVNDRIERHKLVAQALSENDEEISQKIKVTELAYSRLSLIWEDYGIAMSHRDKLERNNYKAFFKVLLAEMGHEIIDLEDEVNNSIEGNLQKNKKEYLKAKAIKIFESPDVLYEDADTNFQQNPSNQNALIKAKAAIVKYLPEVNKSDIWSPDFILKTLKHRDYRTTNDYYYLLRNQEVFK